MKNRTNRTHFETLESRLVLSDTVGPLASSAFAMTQQTDSGVVGDFVTNNLRPAFTWSTPADQGTPPSGTSTNYIWQVQERVGSNLVLTQFGGQGGTSPSANLAEGRYIWFVRYQDNAGNWGDWGGVNFRVATTPTPPPNANLVNDSVIDGDNGFVIPPNDGEAFAAALVRMYSDPFARSAMGRRSRQLVEERYSMLEMCRNHEALYRSLCT